MESKVKVFDAAGNELYVRPIDAKEIVAQGGSYDIADMKREQERENTVIIEGVTTGRADSVPHTPTSPDSARESIDYDAQGANAEGKTENESGEKTPSTGFPKGFPGAAVLEREGIGHHQALRMSREELVAIDGIADKTADAIIKGRE
jgi:hypothetical protein